MLKRSKKRVNEFMFGNSKHMLCLQSKELCKKE